jgi:hypothetical protein
MAPEVPEHLSPRLLVQLADEQEFQMERFKLQQR